MLAGWMMHVGCVVVHWLVHVGVLADVGVRVVADVGVRVVLASEGASLGRVLMEHLHFVLAEM